MKRWIPVLIAIGGLLGLCAVAAAQDPVDPLQEKLEKKLGSAFLKKADWQTDYDKALAKAKEGGKLVFAYFTRSYAT